MRFTEIVALAAACTMLASTPAVAQSYSKSRLIDSIDEASLVATMDSLGIEHDSEVNDDGTTIYSMTFENGFRAVGYFRACDEGCKGLVLLGSFDPPAGMSAAQLTNAVAQFDDTYPAGKLYIAQNGNVYVQWYVIFDEGITMGNLRTQLEVFGDIGAQVSGVLYPDD